MHYCCFSYKNLSEKNKQTNFLKSKTILAQCTRSTWSVTYRMSNRSIKKKKIKLSITPKTYEMNLT